MSNLLKQVDAELEIAKRLNPIMAMGMLAIKKMIVEENQGVISFHRLNGLTPTITSCRDKLFEEIGEYLQLTGKGMKASGEKNDCFTSPRKLIKELADVAQSAVTQMHVIADEAGIDIGELMDEHEAKLIAKGYLFK